MKTRSDIEARLRHIRKEQAELERKGLPYTGYLQRIEELVRVLLD